ncbi:hypothetical protein MMC07_005700 [Pseudocyphellaria aurata]|nr:hypothetical protein [Pseudocyphellaria aurata]
MLCDLRLDREDLRIGVEESLKPPPKPPKLPKGPPQLPKEQPSRASTRSTRYAPPAPPELPPAPRPSPPVAPGGILRLPLRKEAMGADASGTVYWLIDMGRPWGTRLYKETSLAPASKKGTPAPKQRGSQAQPVPAPALELIGTTIEEMQAIGERLSRSKRKPDQRIASILVDEVRCLPASTMHAAPSHSICVAQDNGSMHMLRLFFGSCGMGCARDVIDVVNTVVPSMAAAAAEELRQAKAAERLRNQLGSVMDLGFGRCCFARFVAVVLCLPLRALCASAAVVCNVEHRAASFSDSEAAIRLGVLHVVLPQNGHFSNLLLAKRIVCLTAHLISSDFNCNRGLRICRELADIGSDTYRPKRERKQVNYSYDAYDDMIRDAIRGRRGEGGVPSSRHSDFQLVKRDAGLSELEDSRRSLRRGRSATGPETEHELSPSRRAVTRTPPPPHAHSPVPRNQPAFDGEQHALHGARFREDDLRERSQTEDEPWDRAGDVSDGGSYPDAADGDAEDADRQDDLRWGYRSEHGGHGREYSDEPEEGSQPSGSYQDGFRAASHELEHARRPHDVEISE